MRLRVLFVSPEMSPYARTGGLADVTAALPARLAQNHVDVRVLLPRYRDVTAPLDYVADFPVPMGDGIHDAVLKQDIRARVPTYFLESHRYFDRPGLYGDGSRDYPDNGQRFCFFSRAVLQALIAMDWVPHVVHLNDWPTGMVATYLRHLPDPRWAGVASVFTIHNLAYQGLFGRWVLPYAGLPEELFQSRHLEFWGRVSFLKAGLVHSDVLNTVSPTYAREILTPEFGFGLEGILREREKDLAGILNGVDYEEWNPADDPHLFGLGYSAANLAPKEQIKAQMLEGVGLGYRAGVPVLGMISRLAHQKGFDLLAPILDELLRDDIRMVVLGTGASEYRDFLLAARQRHPGKLAVFFDFETELAHRIEAGSDIFLMPSRYEPCGLNQIYSLRYGTIPVVRRTGGLADTVVDAVVSHQGTGFVFDAWEPAAFLGAVRTALSWHRDADRWRELQQRGMHRDFSWETSATRYRDLYERAVLKRTGWRPTDGRP